MEGEDEEEGEEYDPEIGCAIMFALGFICVCIILGAFFWLLITK